MRRFGPFELEARLGRGGSAEVWRATRRGPHGFSRAVALKRILPERLASTKVRTSLLDEARLAARLEHVNVAQVLEVVEVHGEPAIVMELVDGCELRALLKALAPLSPPPPGLGVFVAHEVGRALGAAHAMRPPILHRDVSATNVLLSRTGGVKLADFGIGKALADDASDGRTGSFKGNLGYMAPEQLARMSVGPAADVYATGVLLWEMLTGRRLFAGVFDVAAMAEARRRAIAPPSTVNPKVPRVLDALVARAMAFAAAERFADGSELAAALEEWSHRLEFGPTQLAALMRAHAPAPVAAEVGRHTVTGAPEDEAATETDPIAPGRRPRFVLAMALAAGGALGAWLALPRDVPAPTVTPPSTMPVATQHRMPTPTPLPTPTTSVGARHKPQKRAPDLVDGKLVDPFRR
jgi:serine/threonine protein kinase